jgi:hypothetical protein
MAIQELEDLKSRVQAMQEGLATVTDDEWQAYVRVRKILEADPGFSIGGRSISDSFRCAMMGIFETPDGPGQPGEYDAGAVRRFADLGE